MEFYGIIETQDNRRIMIVKNRSNDSGWSTPDAAQKATDWYANGYEIQHKYLVSDGAYHKYINDPDITISYWSLK